ncbi:hypothetical protein HLV37_01400 [Eggerthellaceae bacterium zg-1084]|uniref:hypothetical protein n=1 Tax=Berryella wangjianweii TaxID=2734634 RepID=UPI001556CC7B|nr:hypothetical protein [Berryella wangjianweii]NPD30538.1 hypothetical protein [Berryella wangjianweii]
MGQDDLERECEATPEHEAFKGRFRPKLTTDDCLTPPEVHAAVLAWAAREYGFDPSDAVRPFWPGGDFEGFDYPEGCVVVDNPPFSILARIVRFYLGRAIPFLLYAPHLTALGTRQAAVGPRARALPGDGVRRRDGMVPIDS